MELIGRRFGHIRITDVVGQGGMGDVYAGYDEKLDRKVALKVLHAENRLDAESRERLLREARALSKLDHPNICRIHDYIESEDVDLLVLEYIDGETLQDVLLDKQLSRAEKLRISISVAEVLVAAHRLGIIHRDLKPENVMLTKRGEVKVLDFGLARWLTLLSTGQRVHIAASQEALAAAPSAAVPLPAESDHEWFAYAQPREGETAVIPRQYESAPGPPQIRRRFRTEAGVTMGTPLYMSPEQARGEELTPASDMFAFGLFLQAIFTGTDPHPPGLTAREVILRAARGETIAVSGVSGDIAAVINRLKQFAPADRPTAIETVARLRFLADKTRRLVRRSAIAAAIAIMVLGAWRYTVDLAHERTIAVRARAEADRRRAQAEDLIEFMVGDLRAKLDGVGRLDILDAASERLMQYVSSLRPESMSLGELTRNAKALNQLGEVRNGQGKTPAALDLFGRSLRLANEAVKRDPKNGDALMVFGQTHFWIGNGLQTQGKIDDALQHMREYMRAGDALAALDPNKKEYQLEKAYGHSSVAYMLEQKGQLDEAREHYMTSLALREELARRDPGDADTQAEVARAYNKLAVLRYKQGDLRGSLNDSRREVEMYRRLVAFEPQQMKWKMRLANSIAYLVRALEDSGDSAAAFPLLEEELSIEKMLAARDPENVDWQRNAAMTTRWIARALADGGDLARAGVLFAEAREKMKDVVLHAPTHASFAIDALNVESEYGRLLAQQGDPRAADVLRNTVRGLQAFPDSRYARYQVGRTSFFLGEALQKRDPQKAAAAWADAETQLAPLIEHSKSPDELAVWARVLIRRNRFDEARVTLQRLRDIGYATAQLETLCAGKGC
jgi:serine/threonine protein kinase